MNVLSGAKPSIDVQVGANDGQIITIDLQKIDSTALGLKDFTVAGTVDFDKAQLTDLKGGAISADKITTDDEGKNPVDLLSYKTDAGETKYAVLDSKSGKYNEASIEITGEGSTAKAVVTIDTAKEVTDTPTGDPLKALDKAIAQVDNFRSSSGAVQNRLDSAVTNLNNTTTNLSEAQSRIQDADYATEVSNMSKAQIIQQAGNSVLSKANRYRSRFCLCFRANLKQNGKPLIKKFAFYGLNIILKRHLFIQLLFLMRFKMLTLTFLIIF